LTRHGQTEWNKEDRMQGWKDSQLTKEGILQAVQLRDALKQIEFDVIYASSSERTRRTAEILRHQRSCNLIFDKNLREINLGEWEGHTRHSIQKEYPDAYNTFWEAPHVYYPTNNGESFYDLQQRVLPLINTLVTKHKGQTIFIVTHAIVLKLIMSYFEKRSLAHLWKPPVIHPTALCKVLLNGQQASIQLYGDTSHYSSEKSSS
jgi:phosphoserine phosphatase